MKRPEECRLYYYDRQETDGLFHDLETKNKRLRKALREIKNFPVENSTDAVNAIFLITEAALKGE